MAAISKEHGRAGADEAVARVGEYLLCLGLPADRAQAEAAAVLERCAAQPGATQADLSDLALAEVMSRFDVWLNDLWERAGEPAGCRPALLAWRLRPLLAVNADVFLRRQDPVDGDGGIVERVRLAVKASAEPTLPEPTPTPMPAQSFGPAPQVFQPGFWRRVVAQLVRINRGIVRRIKGG